MHKPATLVIVFLSFSMIFYGNDTSPLDNKTGSFPGTVRQNDDIIQSDTIKPASRSTNSYFPFQLIGQAGDYNVTAPVEIKGPYAKYTKLFKKYGYGGNGYCWEGHILQILEKLDRSLLDHIYFDSEGGAFYATIDNKENQLRFVKLLSPIFSDLRQLEQWVKKADRSRISD